MRAIPRLLGVLSIGLLTVTGCDTGNLTQPAGTAPNSSTPPQSNVATILVSPDTADIAVGDVLRLRATVIDQFGTQIEGRDVQWRVSQGGRVKITSDGIIEGLTEGEDTVSASLDGFIGRAILRLRSARVRNVVVSLEPARLTVGGRGRAVAQLYTNNNQPIEGNVYWTSSNRSVATVDDAGNITARATGRAIITAISEGKSDSETLDVGTDGSENNVGSVVVTASNSVVYVGGTVSLTAVVKNLLGAILNLSPVTWTSSNNSVATVSASGQVTGVAPGSVTITGTSGGVAGQTMMSVTVIPVNTVSLSITPNTMETNQAVNAVVTLYAADGSVLTGRNVNYSSSDAGVATVSSTGVVTGKAAGTASITASSEGKTQTKSVWVSAPPANPVVAPVAQVTISAPVTSLQVGQSTAMGATTKDAAGNVLTGRSITWSSSNNAVATVTNAGVVNALTSGSTTITALSEGISGTVSVSVASAPVTVSSISLTPASVTLQAGAVQQFSANATYSNGSTGSVSVTYTATGGSVGSNGAYTAGTTAGSYRVIAAHSSGRADTSAVTIEVAVVAPPPPPPVNPPAGFSACGNEPTGFNKQVDIGFNMLPGVGTPNADGMRTWWSEGMGTYQLVNDAAAPRGGTQLQVKFPAGMPGGAGPAFSKFQILNTTTKQFFSTNTGQIYICFFIKRSANWSDNGNAGTKTFFVMPEPGTYSGPLVSHFLSYNHTHRPTGCMEGQGLSRCFGSGSEAAEGQWHKLEYLWLSGTPGTANSTVRHWVDGNLVINQSDVLMFHAGQTPKYDWLIWDPTFGGGMNPVPHDQYIWLDHLYVSVK